MSKQPESFSADTLIEISRVQASRPDEDVNEHCHGVALPRPRLSRSFGTLMLVGRHGRPLFGRRRRVGVADLNGKAGRLRSKN